MRDVFISYRRSDTAGHAGRLLDALEQRFDADKFFRDIEGLEPGVDFPAALNRALSQCKAMLVVMGPTWATVAMPDGPRIKQEDDFVRLEVAAGLARKDVRVIPVLVGGATLPKPADLPPDLQALIRRNKFEISDTRWAFDVKQLGDTLDGSVRSKLLSGKRALIAGASAVVLLGAVGAAKLIDFNGEDPLVAQAQRDALIAEANAKKAKADAERAESEAKKRKADLEFAQADSNKAQLEAAAAKQAAERAEAERQVSLNASAEQKAKTEAEAARLAKENEEAQRVATAKAAEAEAARARDDKAQAEATASRVRQEEEAAAVTRTAEVARVVVQKPTDRASPSVLSFPNWTLSSGGCGAGHLTVSGTARFKIDKTAEGILVTEEFRGSGQGFNVAVTGQATFAKPQKSYNIPTTGQWSRGTKVFKSEGTDRVNTSDGITPRTANFIKIQSVCG